MPVQRFRTRPVEIDAMRFTGENHDELKDWTGGNWTSDCDHRDLYGEPWDYRGQVYDALHDTWINVAPGMWIVHGAKGEFYPCDDGTFDWKYEEV